LGVANVAGLVPSSPVADFVFKTHRAQGTTRSTATVYMGTLLMGPERIEVLSTRPRELIVL